MLARYLRTSQQPIRYALDTRDPAIMDAIRNYLGIRMRASELPALTRSEPGVAEAHRTEPLLGHAFHTLLQSGHPADLMAYLDLLHDRGDSVHPQSPFRGSLEAMAHYVGTDARHPEIARLFGQQAVEHPSVRLAISQHAPPGLRSLIGALASSLSPEHPLHRSLEAARRTLFSSPSGPAAVPALLRAHDVGHALASGMQDLGHTLPQVAPFGNSLYGPDTPTMLRNRSSETLRRVVWPHLAHATGGM